MGVDLGGGHVLVAEEPLHGAGAEMVGADRLVEWGEELGLGAAAADSATNHGLPHRSPIRPNGYVAPIHPPWLRFDPS